MEGSSNFMIFSWYVLQSFVAKAIVVMFLVCYVIKQDHVSKGSGDYNDATPSR